MNREEAIQILSTRDAHGVLCGYTSGVAEALDMAIEALKGGDAKMDNCQAQAPQNYMQQSRHDDGRIEVVRCKDCRYCTEYYDKDGYPYWECAEWDSGTDADGYCHYGERREP